MAHEAKLTIREAAAYTGFPTSTIGHAAKLDPPRLRSYKAGPNGPYYFTKSHSGRMGPLDGNRSG
jgi:hypothetical protein